MKAEFAYVFERFPSFTQTFCAREVAAIEAARRHPVTFSIRAVSDEAIRHFPDDLVRRTTVLPPADIVAAEVQSLKQRNLLPPHAVVTLRNWGSRPDKNRACEALWIGHRLREAGVRHVHTHFAGIGARTCWWIRRFYGLSCSFTGHANDLFCPDESSGITLPVLVGDASLVVTVSDFTRDWLRSRHPAHADRIHRVYNGMDIPTDAPPWPRNAGDGLPVIASVGRLIEKKGFADLIHACDLLRARGLRFRCVIAGDGPLHAELSQLIADRSLADVVTLAGPMAQPEVTRLLAASRVFALACVIEKDGGMDVLPTVIMEAMAAGLPCVSTRVAGVPEMIRHGETGALAPPADPAALAAAIEPYLVDHDLAAAHGTAGHRMARDTFDVRVTSASLFRLLAAHGRLRVPAHVLVREPDLLRARLRFLARRWHPAVRPPRLRRDAPAFPES